MNPEPIEIYHPRTQTDHGIWTVGPLQIKAYGILAQGKSITPAMLSKAQRFLNDEVLPLVEAEGESNGLGFVIIHPGDLGISISAHWWIQGSVLCQHIHRQLYDADEPMDTVTRPVVACVWELAIINAEQEVWRKTMMKAEPDRKAYLRNRANFEAA